MGKVKSKEHLGIRIDRGQKLKMDLESRKF